MIVQDSKIKITFDCSFDSKTKIRNFCKNINKDFVAINFVYSHWNEIYCGFDILILINQMKALEDFFDMKIDIWNRKSNVEIKYKIENTDNIYQIFIY